MNRVRSLFFLNIASLFRSVLGLFRFKFTSIWLGVEGVGVLGQILSFFNLQTRLSGFGIYSLMINQIGKIKIEENAERYHSLLFFSLLVLIITNIIFITFQLIFVGKITQLLFGTTKYFTLVYLLIFLGPLFSIAQFFEVLVRAHSNFSKLALGQNITYLSGLISIIPMIYIWGEKGVVLNFYFFLLINLFFFFKHGRHYIKNFTFKYYKLYKDEIFFFLKFCFVDTFRKTLIFVSLIVFRIFIVNFLDLKNNGYFQSIWSISNLMDFILTSFLLYLYPTLSRFNSKDEFNKELNKNIEYFVYMFFPAIGIILLFPEIFLQLLFTKEFVVMSVPLKMFAVVKILNMLYNYFMIAFLSQSRLKQFLIVEIIRSTLLIFLAFFLIQSLQINGAILSIILVEIVTIIAVVVFILIDRKYYLSYSNLMLLIRLFGLSLFMLIPLNSKSYLRIVQSIIFVFVSLYLLNPRKYLMIWKMFRTKN